MQGTAYFYISLPGFSVARKDCFIWSMGRYLQFLNKKRVAKQLVSRCLATHIWHLVHEIRTQKACSKQPDLRSYCYTL